MEIDLEEMAKSLPPEAMPVLQRAGYFEPDRLNVGAQSPRLWLSARADGRSVEIGRETSDSPTVLLFGSYT